jgi:hypothetical protein
VLDGDPATNDIMDGIDTTWSRVPGGAEIGRQADEIIAQFDTNNPSASVDALLKLRKNLAALAGSPLVELKNGNCLINFCRNASASPLQQPCRRPK